MKMSFVCLDFLFDQRKIKQMYQVVLNHDNKHFQLSLREIHSTLMSFKNLHLKQITIILNFSWGIVKTIRETEVKGLCLRCQQIKVLVHNAPTSMLN